MSVAAPLWLLGLIPWAALAVWMLLRRQSTTVVPFLPIWNVGAIPATSKPRIGLPPLWIVLLLSSIALAIVGAARPQVRSRDSARLIAPPLAEAHLVYLAAGDTPHAQVMLRILTRHFDRPAVEVVVSSGDQRVVESVPVEANATKTVFIDLPKLAATVTASIGTESPLTIAREGKGLRVADAARVPPALQRLIDIYRKQRPTGADQATITVGSAATETESGIILLSGTAAETAALTVRDDPLTRNVDWSKLAGGVDVSPDWEPLVFRGKSVMVARRTTPVKQVLVSVSTADWPAMPSFVMFWTNALDWLAGGDGRFILKTASPSPGKPGEGGGEGEFERGESSAVQNHPQSHTSPLPDYQERGLDLDRSIYLSSLAALLFAMLLVPHRAFPYTGLHGHDSQAANSHR